MKRRQGLQLLAHLEEAKTKTIFPFHLDGKVPKNKESTIWNCNISG